MDPKTIFIVEDESSIRLICKRLLAGMGHVAVFAQDVRDAIEILAGLKNVHLLVTDMRLPDGDGLEIIRRTRERFPAVKILVITGSPILEGLLDPPCELGFSENDVLLKPFEISQFIEKVRMGLEESLDRASG
jgi:CheY-like chemotaxis protein